MTSPFQFFRKHRTGMMVVMVILSMLIFTLDALFTAEGANFWLLGLMVGGAVFGVFGVGSGRWLQWGIGGAILGALMGVLLPDFVRPDGLIDTKFGVIGHAELNELQEERRVAKQFMAMVTEETIGQGASRFARHFVFNQPNIEYELLFGKIMQEEADKLGIVVTNDMVNDYINENTLNKLTGKTFSQARRSTTFGRKSLDEDVLYDILRRQIKAEMAYRTLLPHPSVIPPCPEVYWEFFRRMNVRQQMNVTELSVDVFLDQVEQPSDVAVEELFAARRGMIPGEDEPGSPGFRLPGRARIAWLELDYDSVETSLEEISDGEIEAHYNENRDTRYRTVVIPDPHEDSGNDEEREAASAPAKAPSSEEDRSAAGETETETDDETAEAAVEEASPDADTDLDSPATVASESTSLQNDSLGENDSSAPDAASDNRPLLIPEFSDDKDPAEADGTSAPPMEFKYRELDDDLKSEIRDELLAAKVNEATEERMQKSVSFMLSLASRRRSKQTEILNRDPAKFSQEGDGREAAATELRTELAALTPKLMADMKGFAEENGFVFVETPFLSQQEFLNEEDYPLGSATDPNQSANTFGGGGDPVAVMLFSSFSADEMNNDTQLFMTQRAVYGTDVDGGTESYFAYWAIDFSLPHVPTLDEPGIRDKVVLALKRREARKLLRARADELSEKVRDGLAKEGDARLSMAASLEGETIVGRDDSAVLLVRLTQPFSWMRSSQAAPMSFRSQQRAEISRIRFADGSSMPEDIDTDFMATVFDELADAEVGIVSNFDRTKYYIVHVTNRFPTPKIGMDKLRERFSREGQLSFLNTPVLDAMQREITLPAIRGWMRSMWLKYEIDPDGTPL